MYIRRRIPLNHDSWCLAARPASGEGSGFWFELEVAGETGETGEDAAR